jgi:hypothetical protein
LWFTEDGLNRIGRITPDGVVTEFAEGISANAELTGITAGPDGNLWFTEATGNRIGQITPSGAVTEFASGLTTNSQPNRIAAGADGSLWFTEQSGEIGRLQLAHPQLHNAANPLDVTGDGFVAPNDALAVINFLNEAHPGAPPPTPGVGPPFFDVNDDGAISPIDALMVINAINARQVNHHLDQQQGDALATSIRVADPAGTAAQGNVPPSASLEHNSGQNFSDLIAMLAADTATQILRRR